MLDQEIENLTEKISSKTLEKINNLNFIDSKENRIKTLNQLKDQLQNNSSILSLKNFFKLTKTQKNYGEVYLMRDLEVESKVKEKLSLKQNYNNLLQSYKDYDNSLEWVEWPQHYAVRLLAGNGPFSTGKNIFAFFPEALGLIAQKNSDVIGLEFIDSWFNVFKNVVYPCVQKTFSVDTQFNIYQNLMTKTDFTVYLASVFHEIGHRCGPWKVSPRSNSKIKINAHHWGILGEISTDSLLVQKLEEYPEIALFVTLQRLFWFGRRGYNNNPINGMLNEDNDSWLGAYLWEKLKKVEAIKINRFNKWELFPSKLTLVFKQITDEIDQLSDSVLKTDEAFQQNLIIENWMKNQVEWNSTLGYILPSDLQIIFEECYSIPEVPSLNPLFSLSDFRDLSNKIITKI